MSLTWPPHFPKRTHRRLWKSLICGLLCSECWKTWKAEAIFSRPEDHCNNKDNGPMELQIFIVLYAFPKHFHIHYCNQLRQQPFGLQLRKEKSWGPCSRSYSQVVGRLGLEARLHDWASISSRSSPIRLSRGHALWPLWPLTHSILRSLVRHFWHLTIHVDSKRRTKDKSFFDGYLWI